MDLMIGSEFVPRRVSVIMPFLDTREVFLSEAVESVRRQTYDNWELILIDDGSKAVISQFARNIAETSSGRIIYLEHHGHRNLGISASRNLGLSAAKGEYVAFLDSDDVWDDDQLNEQLQIFAEQPDAAMLYGNTLYWRSWVGETERSGEDFQFELGVETPRLFQPPDLLQSMLEGRAISPCMTSIVVRRNVFAEGCVFEAAFPRHYEDQVFIAKVLARHPAYVVDRRWGRYRQHTDATTADGDNTEIAQSWRVTYLNWLSGSLSEVGLRGTSVWRALSRETWLTKHASAGRLVRRFRALYRFLAGRFSRLVSIAGIG
jgi:glycosyltransferase involved in cell wall biosynthesis